ncbi:conserved hypothetical protein [Mesorhizobium sp. STM 4661]|nr:conserved hypothetical protein [Mesorhizobium sp. STM 4661]
MPWEEDHRNAPDPNQFRDAAEGASVEGRALHRRPLPAASRPPSPRGGGGYRRQGGIA